MVVFSAFTKVDICRNCRICYVKAPVLLQTSSARESTPEPPAYKKKTRVRKEKKRIELEDEDNNDEEFVITSKSKAHKKIKVDPKNAFGGNIHRPRWVP